MSKADPLIEVDRVISELRRGASVRVELGEASVLMLAAEAVSPESLNDLALQATSPPALVMTGTRANVLGLDKSDRQVCVATTPGGLDKALIDYLANPLSALEIPPDLTALHISAAGHLEQACITLAKLSRLLPAAIVATAGPATDTLNVSVSAIEAYMNIAADSLRVVSEARVPLEAAEHARVVAFRPRDGGIEHLAIIVG